MCTLCAVVCGVWYWLHMRGAVWMDSNGLYMPAGPIFNRKLCGGANASGMLFHPEAFSPVRKQPMLQPAEAPPWQVVPLLACGGLHPAAQPTDKG